MSAHRRVLGLAAAMTTAVLLAAGAAPAFPAGEGRARDQDGRGPERLHMRLVGRNDLRGFGNGGEGFGQVKTHSGRRILYVAHESGPKCFSVLDVTNPRRPRLLRQTEVPNDHTRCNSLDVSGDLLLVANQVSEPGQDSAGLQVYDIGRPRRPHHIGFFDTSGPYSRGVHYVWITDGRYAYLSTGMPDFQPRRVGQDDQIFVIVDLADPRNPVEVGRWWYPGTRVGDPEPLPTPNRDFDSGCRAHNTDVFPEEPDRAYIGYIDCGVVVLDISDKNNPRLLYARDDSPPTPGFTHTVVPFDEGRGLIVAHESVEDDCIDFPKDITLLFNQPDLRRISVLPLPDNLAELCDRGGRFGAHNIHEPAADEPTFQSRSIIFASFFNGGVRAYDISDPRLPREVAYYVPRAPWNSPAGAIQINDVYVDDRGVIFATDRFAGGLYVLRSRVTRRP